MSDETGTPAGGDPAQGGTGRAASPTPRADCLCMGVGPELTQLLRRLAPSQEAWQHLRAAEIELLKAIRAALDERIQTLSRETPRGTRVDVE